MAVLNSRVKFFASVTLSMFTRGKLKIAENCLTAVGIELRWNSKNIQVVVFPIKISACAYRYLPETKTRVRTLQEQ